MSFVTQEDVFATLEPMHGAACLKSLRKGAQISHSRRFERISYDAATRCRDSAPTSPICETRSASSPT